MAKKKISMGLEGLSSLDERFDDSHRPAAPSPQAQPKPAASREAPLKAGARKGASSKVKLSMYVTPELHEAINDLIFTTKKSTGEKLSINQLLHRSLDLYLKRQKMPSIADIEKGKTIPI